jgi:CubicO group peptidase (beta-lactamase class C family)
VVRFLEPSGTPAALSAVGYDGRSWDTPANLVRGQISTAERMRSAELESGGAARPLPSGESLDLEAAAFTDPLTGRTMTGAQFLDRRLRTDALAVVKDGRVVFETYRDGMVDTDRHVVHSCTKTLTSMLVGIAVDEGRIDVEAPIAEYVEELGAIAAWDGVSLQHVLDMAAGIDTEEHYELPDSMYWRYAAAVEYYEQDAPGEGALAFVLRELTRRSDEPGTRFNYASYLTNLLPIAVQRAYGVPALELLEERIYRHLGAEQPALLNLDSTGLPIVEGQANLTLRDFVRWGHLLLDGGRTVDGRQVVPSAWVAEAFRPDPARAQAFARGESAEAFPGAEYHNQTWLPEPGRTATMLGIHGQFCWVDPEQRLMVVGMSSFPDQVHPLMTSCLAQLWSTARRETA